MVRLGQNFLADPNLLDAIVRDAGLACTDVVLEVGAGEGVLSERLAAVAAHLHAVEIDRGLQGALEAVAARPNVSLHWGDAMKLDLAALDPAPTAMVANLPYSVATPLILRTIELLPSLATWTVMVQREIADRL
ncbi:MAG TPA: rRNA adenine N-6-methyltransferase family protein, partial [Solirubrobacterales bacterium]|nr:rRNA adenine N-6-methyltransferase family protein [Solirubrobacterales bacterium]